MEVSKIYEQFQKEKPKYEKIQKYFKGNTDSFLNYKQESGRSNLKVNCNYLKKFVKEETSYSVGNSITYGSKTSNPKIQENLDIVMENFKENHDVNVFLNMVLYGKAYEVYFLDKWGEIQVKYISPTNGYHTEDAQGIVTGFIHSYTLLNEEGELEEFIDYYTETEIQHLNKDFNPISASTIHYFEEVPVGVALLSEYGWEDTIYSDIKGLQDALETNLSDITNEVSDFRSAYLSLSGVDLGDDAEERSKSAKQLKELGIMLLEDGGKAEWLVKNINDSFIQNTIRTLQEKMYELTSHINHNDVQQSSNASGVALKSKLISLMQRCVINQNSYMELLKTRIRCIFTILNKQGSNLNWKDVKITFKPCIPNDDYQISQIIQMLQGIVSDETLMTQLSFIENPLEEIEKRDSQNGDTYSELGNDTMEEKVIEEDKITEEDAI